MLEDAAVPITRCLTVRTLAPNSFAAITVDYLDTDGSSAYQRRWIDDVVLGERGYDYRPQHAEVEIQTPADGSTLLQRADEATTAVVIIRGITREPSVELTLNGGYVTNGHAHLASGSDPFTWEFDAPIPPRMDGFHGHLVPRSRQPAHRGCESLGRCHQGDLDLLGRRSP